MRIVVAPQEFKGSLTAVEAARAIAAGVRDALPDADVIEIPMSDGGAGLVDALLAARGGKRVATPVHDPLMRPITASWVVLSDGVAAIEMAAASGLVLVQPAERNPLRTTTYGTGELILAALNAGCDEIIVGVGGSATVDGGGGAIQALGGRLLDNSGDDLPPGGAALQHLHRIDTRAVDARLSGSRIRVAADVTNPLCGPTGAAAVYGPQKGATPDDVAVLDAALSHFATIARRDCGVDVAALRGGGAAGGLAAGLAAIAGATIERGFDVVATAVGLRGALESADIVITGEGRLDRQTRFGKTVDGVGRLAKDAGSRVIVVAGSVEEGFEIEGSPFDIVRSLAERAGDMQAATRDASRLLGLVAAEAVGEFRPD